MLTLITRGVLWFTVSCYAWPVAGSHADDFWTSTDGYIALAQTLVETGRFAFAPDVPPTVHRGPAFPVAIALASYVTNSFGDAVMLVNLLASCVITVVMYVLAARVYRPRASFWIALAGSCYPLLVYYALCSWSDVFLAACFGLYTWTTLRVLESRRSRDAAISAVALALTLLAKSVFTPLPVAILLVAAAVRRSWLRLLTIQVVLAVVIVAPWAIRNSLLLGKPTMITSGSGFNMLVGHYMVNHSGNCNAVFRAGRADAIACVERQKGLEVNFDDLRTAGFYDVDPAVDDAMLSIALEQVFTRPLHFVRKITVNLGRFWYFASSQRRSYAVLAINFPLVILAAWELWRNRRAHKRTAAWVAFVVACVWLTYAAVIVHSRFYLPVMPLLLPFAMARLGAITGILSVSRLRVRPHSTAPPHDAEVA